MLVPVETSSAEINIKGSRFLAETFAVETQAQVRSILKEQKQKYADATHVVHAFIAGKNAEIMGMSDDGEPGGTAGRPVLDVLKGRGCTDVMVTVTRWFGGTLLGTGGLVHAYGESAKLVLDKTLFEEYVEKLPFSMTSDYQQYQIIKKVLESFTVYDLNEDFGAVVSVCGFIAAADFDSLSARIFDSTSGRVCVMRQS